MVSMLTTVLEIIRFKPKMIFLIDSIGAFLSANFLLIILSFLQTEFGIFDKRFNFLVGTSYIISISSFCCYYWIDKLWRVFLRTIAIVNLLYCILTTIFLVNFCQSITLLGLAYFIFEITIIICLAVIELKTAQKKYITNEDIISAL
jgi:hypothetical protein